MEAKNKVIKKTFILEGLSCANCAAKIETQINNLSGVIASVDFVSKKLTIESDGTQEMGKLIDKAKTIVKKAEPHVNVISNDEGGDEAHEHGTNNMKNTIIKLAAGGVLFFMGLLMAMPPKLEMAVFFISYLIVGGENVLKALRNIIRGQVFDENFLMTIATIGAFIIGEYPEGAAVMIFYQVGELFQDIAVNRSRRSIAALMDIRPDYANLSVEGELKRVSPEDVRVGDVIVVKPGEKVPLDGRVLEGISTVDTSALTGESVPKDVAPGDNVLSGFINKNGLLTIEVAKEFGESTVSKILDLVQNASSRKAPTENFITKFARYYTPVVVLTALAMALLPPLMLPGASFSDWLYKALIFLVISCPCALVISIPLSFFGGIGAASKKGILVKGSNYLEALNDVETVVFDKTGTLTKGVFRVAEVKPENDFSREKLLELAAYAEAYSNHPIALSILNAYGSEVDKNKIEKYKEIPGHGTVINTGKNEIIAGNGRLMAMNDITCPGVDAIGTVIYIAVDKAFAGYIVISDVIKDDAQDAIRLLKKQGVKKTVMLTGDARTVGDKVGRQLGLDEIHSELLPADKVEKLESLYKQKSAGRKIAFVGDGINDAPVLARADVGIAMGGQGSDAAIEAADIVIMTDEPSKIATAIKIARRTRVIVLQNIIFALGIKLLFLIMGAFSMASMWEAVFADVGVSLLAVVNAMRILRVKDI